MIRRGRTLVIRPNVIDVDPCMNGYPHLVRTTEEIRQRVELAQGTIESGRSRLEVRAIVCISSASNLNKQQMKPRPDGIVNGAVYLVLGCERVTDDPSSAKFFLG
jgi:hypothetical protein